MKKRFLAFGIAVGLALLSFEHNTHSQEGLHVQIKPRDSSDLNDEKFLEIVRTYPKMHRVTEKPYRMHPIVVSRCTFSDPGRDLQSEFKSSIHGNRYCDVFVSEGAKEPIQNAGKSYPVGSVIIKAKYPDDKRGNI